MCCAACWLVVAAVRVDAGGAGPSSAMLNAFGAIPVLEGGRPMPMRAYARLALLQLSGREAPADRSALEWLARIIFDPDGIEKESMLLVSHPEVFDALGLAPTPPRRRIAYADAAPGLERMAGQVARVAALAAAERSPADRELLRLSSAVNLFTALRNGDAPRIWPEGPGDASWKTVAELEQSGDEEANGHLMAWRALQVAWLAGKEEVVVRIAGEIRRQVLRRMDDYRAARRLAAEDALLRLRLFSLALWAHAASALLLAMFGTRADWRGRLGYPALWLALAAQTAGLALRSFIMARPPVTNLYSTFVFVSWACGMAGLWRVHGSRGGAGRWVGPALAAVFLRIAGRYEAEGDTMARLVAVLDSNLWLTAHVVTIMLGYAACLMAGGFGHVALWRRWLRPAQDADLFVSTRRYLAAGLVLTFLGTMLGGMWADQSWGRFWGWDPKENGALLIVLWASAVLHARASRLVGDVGLAAGAVATVAAVLTAWLGVNLLGIGLHSYGFSTGVARGWAAATAFELAYAVSLPLLIRRRRGAGMAQGT